MCGRYQFDFRRPDHFYKRFDIIGVAPSSVKTHYNIAPGQDLPVITPKNPKSVSIMTWGLIPFWEKSDRPAGLINVRDDTIKEKHWVDQYIKFQRCLVPASGFYEWKKTANDKQPFYIHLKDEDYFSFAGLYSLWKSVKGDEVASYAIITTDPNELMQSIHHRMPVILRQEDERQWLDPDLTDKNKITPLLKPFDSSKMSAYRISTRINKPLFNDPELIKPFKEDN